MQKPASYPLKDWIIRGVSSELGINEDICDAVVNWSYRDARDATAKYSSIEFSGFGKIMISGNKLKKRVEKFENIRKSAEQTLSTTEEKSKWEKRLNSANTSIDFYKLKLERI